MGSGVFYGATLHQGLSVGTVQSHAEGKLSRYFTATNAHRYLPVLEDLVRGYNHTVHTTTKMKPADVNALNQHVVWKRMFGHLLHRRKARWVTPPSKAQFEVGDLVRIAKERGLRESIFNKLDVRAVYHFQSHSHRSRSLQVSPRGSVW